MGLEARCVVRFGRDVSEGKASLESEALLFPGAFRLAIPFAEVRSASAEDGRLTVVFREGTAIFELGASAQRWADRIRNPKGLIDKLGVKRESKVSVLGVEDKSFWKQLRERTGDVAEGAPAPDSDLIFLAVKRREGLEELEPLQGFLRRDGAIWLVTPRGRPELKEGDVLAAARARGLVDTKVVRFSETHTAHKLVFARARR